MAEWQRIETAPKDGTDVLGFWSFVYDGDKAPTVGMDVISWHDMGVIGLWRDRDGLCSDGVFTHWMPLPEPPK